MVQEICYRTPAVLTTNLFVASKRQDYRSLRREPALDKEVNALQDRDKVAFVVCCAPAPDDLAVKVSLVRRVCPVLYGVCELWHDILVRQHEKRLGF